MDAPLSSFPNPEMLVPTSDNKNKQLTALGHRLQVITIICMVINIVLALLFTGKIIHRARTREKSSDSKNDITNLPRYVLRKFCTDEEKLSRWMQWEMPTEEVFPLTLATAILVQSSAFLYIATRGIGGDMDMMVLCEEVSELVWAAIWVVPVLTLVFALEFLARSFTRRGFFCRRRFTVIICVLISAVLTAATCIPLKVNEHLQSETCTDLLLQPVSQHGTSGLGLVGVLISMWVVILVAIWSNFENKADNLVEERISAINISTYMLLVAFQMVLLTPYFATSTANSINEPSMVIAEVALNGLGLFCIIAQHFLDRYSKRLTDVLQAPGDQEKHLPHSNYSPGQLSGERHHNFMNVQGDTVGEETTQITESNCPVQKQAHTISALGSILGKVWGEKLVQAMISPTTHAKHATMAGSISSPKQQSQTHTSTSAPSSSPTPFSSSPPSTPSSSCSSSCSSSITSLLPNTHFIQYEPAISPSRLALPRPLPPLPATYPAAPPRPSRSNTPSLNLDIAETLVRNVVIGRVPPRAGGRNFRSLTPIAEVGAHKPANRSLLGTSHSRIYR